jgi:hypothetical protein
MQKKRELKEITLKSKLMKLEPKIDLAKHQWCGHFIMFIICS